MDGKRPALTDGKQRGGGLRGYLVGLRRRVLRALDRSDEGVKLYQDLAINAALFATAVWAIHKYGHKLAV